MKWYWPILFLLSPVLAVVLVVLALFRVLSLPFVGCVMIFADILDDKELKGKCSDWIHGGFA